jgi:hypothetical protein|tara:strand:+ start:1181 stop:1831 length:651 start_codon:yes stop_codon:yes gene_type:complete
MSTTINKKAFIEALRKIIRKELEEVSTSAATPGYMTPNAFSGTGKMDRRDSVASGSGFEKVESAGAVESPINEVMFAVKIKKDDTTIQTIVGASSKGQAKTKVGRMLKGGMKDIISVSRIQPAFSKQMDKKIESVNEGRYHDWRNDESLTPKQKIGRSMREVKNSLNTLSKQIDFNVRLKNELNVDTKSYWKTTHKALNQISERLVKLANKVGKLQ